MAVVEWEPSDRFHTTIDANWSRFKDAQRLRGIELPLAWGNSTLTAFTIENGLVASGTWSGSYEVVRKDGENGRASSRERVGRYQSISGDAVSAQKKHSET